MGTELARVEVELSSVSDGCSRAVQGGRALFIPGAWQLRESPFAQDSPHRGRAERLVLFRQGARNVADGEVLLAQGNHPAREAGTSGGGESALREASSSARKKGRDVTWKRPRERRASRRIACGAFVLGHRAEDADEEPLAVSSQREADLEPGEAIRARV